MKAPAIQLHIDELVLEGVSPHERHHIVDALERELAAQLRGLSLRDGMSRRIAVEAFDAGTVTLRDLRTPTLARSVARAVGGTIGNCVSCAPVAPGRSGP